ncbi:MAG: redoxin domain-containing protein [Acidobacteriota bacterium]|nr:redoxin domain-containing protein [Acidobacteriota bacterium]
MANAGVEPGDDVSAALAGVRTESGKSLLELAEASPVLLVFLRHFGCSFCRKAISDVAELRSELAKRGVRPVFVHLGPPELAKVYFEYYGIADVERVSDPGAEVYRLPVFALGKKNPLGQALNPVVWAGWMKGAIFKHGIGKIEGDGTQMPGVFFLRGGRVVRGFRARTIADEPKYLKLVA